MEKFEIKIVDESLGIVDEDTPQMACRLVKAIASQNFIVGVRVYKPRFLKRPWWMFWVSRPDYFRIKWAEQLKQIEGYLP